MAVLTVGSGLEFSTLKAAVLASHDGDTIYVEAGTYNNDFSTIKTKISIVGVGGMANFVATVTPPNGKAILTVDTSATLDHIELQGAKVGDKNGAGVRYENGDLTITNSYFHDNQEGILANPHALGESSVTIDNSEFARNGAGDGRSHNIYVGHVSTFTITDSYIHEAVLGHEIKSRADVSLISNNRIYDLNATASYSVDLPNGGDGLIQNNVIQQGPKSENFGIIAYGEEGTALSPHLSLLIEDNLILNQEAKAGAVALKNRSPIVADLVDNQYFGLGPNQIVSFGQAVQSGDQTLASMPVLDTSHPWADSPWDSLIYGGIGDDIVHGTAGRDLMVGGTGNDLFIVRAGGKSDTIADFTPGDVAHDTVGFEGFSFTDFASVQAAMTPQGTDVALSLGNGEVLTFLNVAKGDFTSQDFSFAPTDPVVVDPFTLLVSGHPTTNISGNYKSNLLNGTTGNDSITGNAGADTMHGGDGDDTYVVESTHDVVVENANQGIDTVDSKSASYTLPGNVENLTLLHTMAHNAVGNVLNNLIVASNGNDTIDAAGGNDFIRAGTGADVLTGGTGNDMFVFAKVGAQSTIADFHPGEDLLDIRPLLADYHGTDPVADGILAISANGTTATLIAVDPAHTGTMHNLVVLDGVTPDMIHPGYELIW